MITYACVLDFKCTLTDLTNVSRLLRGPGRPGKSNRSERWDREDGLPELGAKRSFAQINAAGRRGQSRL